MVNDRIMSQLDIFILNLLQKSLKIAQSALASSAAGDKPVGPACMSRACRPTVIL